MNTINNSQRNYGIDLLRLVAAFYVIVLHTLNQGGLYQATAVSSYQKMICRILLITSFCAVNIFGIISGYVGYREPLKKTSYSGYLPLWLTVVLYGIFFAGINIFLIPDSVTVKELVKAVLPVTTNTYWYFSAFTFVYFLSPFLNRILYYSPDKELKLLFFLICCVFSVIEFLKSSFAMHSGYSALWLVLLYLVGGILKKTKIGSRISVTAAFLLTLAIDIIFLLLGLKWPKIQLFGIIITLNCPNNYITPFYLAAAIFHVILFSQLHFRRFWQKVIAFAAPASFSVYILNTNPLFWNYFMKDRFVSWATLSPGCIFIHTVLFSFGFVSAVVVIDSARQKLFSHLGVKIWADKLTALFLCKKSI